MRPRQPFRLILAVALLLHLLPDGAGASPLPVTADPTGSSVAPVWSPLTLEQLLHSDPGNESDPRSLLLGTSEVEPLPLVGESGETWDERQIGAPVGQRSLGEQLRGYVNVERPQRSPSTAADPRRIGPPPFAGIDFGEAADAWVRDTVQALVQSTLKLEVDEQGRAYFSVLGFGAFSLTLSGDRSRLMLSGGDHVLFLAERPDAAATNTALDPGPDPVLGFGQGAPPMAYGEHWLREALERVTEVASHPLSLLVYSVVAAYVVLWSILSQQRTRPRTSSGFDPTPARSVQADASSGRRRSRRSAGTRSAHAGSHRSGSAESGASTGRRRPGTSEVGSSSSKRRSATAETVGSSSGHRAGTSEAGASTGRRRKRIRIRLRTRTRRTASN
jgi:hypothetical protein